MTAPIVLPQANDPLSDAAKFTSSILGLLEEQRARKAQEQSTLARFGELKLQQQKLDEDLKTQREKKSGLEQEAQGAVEELSQLKEPGPFTKETLGAFQSGDPDIIKAQLDKNHKAITNQKFAAIAGEYAKLNGGKLAGLTIDQQIGMYQEMQAIDPTNTSIGNNLSTLMAARGKASAGANAGWQKSKNYVNGQWRWVFTKPATGEEKVGGVADEPYTAMLGRQGTTDQRDKALFGVQMRESFDGMRRIEQQTSSQNIDIANEVAPMLAKMEIAGNVRIPIAGSSAESILRQYGLQDLSPEAQEYMTYVFNWRAAKNFASGGKTLTLPEILESTRGYMPYLNEDPASRAAKIRAQEIVTRATENLGGGATALARKGAPGASAPVTPPTPQLKYTKPKGKK